MNEKKYFRIGLLAAVCVCGFATLSSCSEDLTIRYVNSNEYGKADGMYCYLRDAQSGRMQHTIDLYDDATARFELYLGLSRIADSAVDATIEVDPDYLASYNTHNGTSYEIYPALNLVELEESGTVVIAPGDNRSGMIGMTIGKDLTVEPGKVYAIPFSALGKSPEVKCSDDAHYMLFVKDAGAVPDATKGAVKNVVFIEVNDTNPLNLLEWNLQSNGKPICDIAVIFAANINYDEESGRVYVFNNPNVQFLLDHRTEYLKPLKDRGMKIVMAILGNHDRAGISQLADATAREFARELSAYCQAYDLDGVCFDDEYSGTPIGPGFVPASSSAAARLCYETKRAMPDKICSVYAYLLLQRLSDEFDNMRPGDYLDFAVPDYGATVFPSDFVGMTQSQCGGKSIQIRDGYTASEYAMSQLKNKGFGYVMNFGMHPSVYDTAKITFEGIARGLYDDELDFSGYYYEQNSTVRKPISEYRK